MTASALFEAMRGVSDGMAGLAASTRSGTPVPMGMRRSAGVDSAFPASGFGGNVSGVPRQFAVVPSASTMAAVTAAAKEVGAHG